MNSVKHTPGPWEIRPRIHAEMHASIFGSDGQLVVNLGDGGNGIETQNANAALIASAPYMLDALKALLSHPKLFPNDGDWRLRAALEAVNKAEGRSPL